MSSFAKAILSILILGFAITGIYFGTLKVLDIFQKNEKSTLKKQVPVKPKNMKEKQALVESGESSDEEFTFFDTLNDPSMSKFVGLNGSVVESTEPSNDKLSKSVNLKVNDSSIPPENTISPKKSLDLVAVKVDPPVEAKEKTALEMSGFALQVGSFQRLERADLLKGKLGKKGYPTFVVPVRIPGKADMWYRVFIGRFSEKEAAIETAHRIKEAEKLDSVMMWQESSRS